MGTDVAGQPTRRASLALAAAAIVLAACGGSRTPTDSAPGDPDRGAAVFAASCLECHGADAAGTAQGPPLVDSIYRSSHHGDAAFLVAVRRGVPQHHWNFGAMPPQQGLTDEDIRDVTAYVRRLQQAAGTD